MSARHLGLFALTISVVGFGAGACGDVLGSEDTPPITTTTPTSDAAPQLEASTQPDSGVDGGQDAGPGCTVGTERLEIVEDGSVNPDSTNDHQDFSDQTISNLNNIWALVRFKRVESAAATRLLYVTLTIPRATSNECGSSCAGAGFQGAGTMLVRHMRTDWSNRATWSHRIPPNAKWNTDGALGAEDATAPIVIQVAKPDPAVATMDGALLNPAFLTTDEIAFHIQAQPHFQFIVQRRRSTDLASPRPTLDVTFCKD